LICILASVFSEKGFVMGTKILSVLFVMALLVSFVGQASAQRCNAQQSQQQVSTASAVQAAALAQPLLTQQMFQPAVVQPARSATATATSGRVASFLRQQSIQSVQPACTDCQQQAVTVAPASVPALAFPTIQAVPVVVQGQSQKRQGLFSRVFDRGPVSKSISTPRRSVAIARG